MLHTQPWEDNTVSCDGKLFPLILLFLVIHNLQTVFLRTGEGHVRHLTKGLYKKLKVRVFLYIFVYQQKSLHTALGSSEVKEKPLVIAWPEQTGSAAGTSSCIDLREKTGLHWKLLACLIIYRTYCFFSCSVALNYEKVKNWQRLLHKESVSMNNFLQICKWKEITLQYFTVFYVVCTRSEKRIGLILKSPLKLNQFKSVEFMRVIWQYMLCWEYFFLLYFCRSFALKPTPQFWACSAPGCSDLVSSSTHRCQKNSYFVWA